MISIKWFRYTFCDATVIINGEYYEFVGGIKNGLYRVFVVYILTTG